LAVAQQRHRAVKTRDVSAVTIGGRYSGR
jgi:hypothetical protein